MSRPIFNTLKLDNAIRWATWCLEAIDNPEFYKKNITTIYIDRYRGRIPYDFVKCEKTEIIDNAAVNSDKRSPMRTSGDPFLKDKPNRGGSVDATLRGGSYNIEGNYIFVDFEEGAVQMAYWALPMDTNGYLMIPDNRRIIQAIESYIKFRHLEILSDIGQVDYGKVQKEEQEYMWYVGQAQSEHFMSNLDTAETMTNIISQLYPDRLQHRKGYQDIGEKEFRRLL